MTGGLKYVAVSSAMELWPLGGLGRLEIEGGVTHCKNGQARADDCLLGGMTWSQ